MPFVFFHIVNTEKCTFFDFYLFFYKFLKKVIMYKAMYAIFFKNY